MASQHQQDGHGSEHAGGHDHGDHAGYYSRRAKGSRRLVHVPVVGDLVATAVDLLYQLGVGFCHVAWHVEAGFDGMGVQQVQDSGGGHAGAVLGHGHEAGQFLIVWISV